MKSARKSNHIREARIERRRAKRELSKSESGYGSPEDLLLHRQAKKEVKPLRALTEAQGHYLTSITNNIITFAIGPAGTGKTYISGGYASDQLKEGNVEQIIITRPGVEAGKDWGALPGELEDKFAPFFEPFMDVLNERLGKSQTEYYMKRGVIQAKPLEFMRGKTFKNAIVILDEAQNTTPEQMKLFLTRIGENCKVIIDGDIAQKDIRGKSGLEDAINRLKGIPSIRVVEFEVDDIVRSGIVRDIIEAYQ
jgi:phosphate starvation-inducible PhoH-like protein